MNRSLMLSLLLGVLNAQAQSTTTPMLTPAGTVITNQATTSILDDAGQFQTVRSNTVRAVVQAVCAVTITPSAQQAQGAPGKPHAFTFTVSNMGNAPYALSLGVSAPQNAGASVSPDTLSLQANGMPDPTIQAGSSADVVLTVTPSQAGDASAVLTAACATGETAQATATVHAVLQPVTLLKSQSADQVKALDPERYTLTLTNPNDVAVTVSVRDPLDAHLSYVSSSPAADTVTTAAGISTLTWQAVTVPARGTTILSIASTVRTGTDEAEIPNTASLSQPLFPDAQSNTVVAHLFDPSLTVLKQAERGDAQVGEHLGYTIMVGNRSTSAVFSSTRIEDTLPAGERYVPGSGMLDGQPAEPAIAGQVLTWTGRTLAPGESSTLSYQVLFTLDALPGVLVNTVTGTAIGANGSSSRQATASVQVRALRSQTDIIGTVFVDSDGDGVPSRLKTPVSGARVILAGGREAVSDAQGRFHFADLASGQYALYLNPASVPLPASAYPGDSGRTGARLVQAYGLTQVNFPLTAPALSVSVQRVTTVRAGPVTLTQTVREVSPGHFGATTRLTATAAATYLLINPAPAGATSVTGDQRHEGRLAAGESVDFGRSFDLTSGDPVSDPDLTVTTAP